MRFLKVPYIGNISAGVPREIGREVTQEYLFPSDVIGPKKNVLCARVKGNSMTVFGIRDQEFILLAKTRRVKKGDVVVAKVKDKYTIKPYQATDDHIILASSNVHIKDKRENITILGKVFNTYKTPEPAKTDAINTARLNKVLVGAAEEVLKELPARSIDLVVTSPPYDKIRDYHGFDLDLHTIGQELFRVLKDGSVVAMVIQDQTKNFGKSLTSFRTIIDWCDTIGFKLFETVIYRKYGAEGAWWNKRFRVDHEYIPIFLKGDRPAYFNKEELKIPSKHGGKTMRGGGTRLTNGKRIDTRRMIINAKKCRGTVWEYLTAGDGTRLKHKHPATFPDRLPVDFIKCFCPQDGIVLDPMCGSGTTLLAAKELGRKYIGIDISQKYCDLASRRLGEESTNQKLPLAS